MPDTFNHLKPPTNPANAPRARAPPKRSGSIISNFGLFSSILAIFDFDGYKCEEETKLVLEDYLD